MSCSGPNEPHDLRKAPRERVLTRGWIHILRPHLPPNFLLPWFPHLRKWQLNLSSCLGQGQAVQEGPWCLSPPLMPCLLKQPILWSRQQNPSSPSSQDHHVITTSPWGYCNILLCGLTLCTLFHIIIRGILFNVKSDHVSLITLQRLPASQGKPTSLRCLQSSPIPCLILWPNTPLEPPSLLLFLEHTKPQGPCTHCSPCFECCPAWCPHDSPLLPLGLCSDGTFSERHSVCT